MINKIITEIKKYYKYLLEHKIIFDILLLLMLSIIPFLSYSNVIIPETDIGYDINPLHSFLRKAFLWDGGFNFGIPVTNTINFYNIFNVSLSELNVSSFAIKQIWLSLLLFVTGLSMYYFVGVFFGKGKRLFKIISSVTYMYSLFLIRTLMGASTTAIGYVILPLILGLYINGLKIEKKYLYYAILIGLTSIIFSNINFTYIVIDIVAIFLFLLVYLLRYKKINLLHIFKFNILILFLGLLISVWWIMPLVKISTLGQEIVAEGLGVETPNTYNVRSSYLETFRLLGDLGFSGQYKGVPYVLFSKFYTKNLLWIISTFLFAVLSICGLFFIRSKRKRLYLILLLVFFSAMAVGAYPITNPTITGRIYLWCYDHIPLFSIFRNGYKSVAIISFVYAVLFGCFVSSIYAYLKKKFERTNKSFYKVFPVIFVSLIFGLVLLNSFPLWMGKIFDDKKFKTVPSYWYEVANYLNSQSLDFRVFMLPDSYFPVYYWGSPRGDVALALINKPSIESMGRAWGYKSFTKLFYENISNKDLFGRILSLSNTKYIIQRNDIDWLYYNCDSPIKTKKMLSARDDLRLEKRFGELDLYRVNDNYFSPRIYSPAILSYVANDVDSIGQVVFFNDYNLQAGIFFSGFKLNESDKNEFISNKINSIFVPLRVDKAKVEELQILADQTEDIKLKQDYEKKLNLYKNRVVLDNDYSIEIPRKAIYEVYINKDSLLGGNKDLIIKIGNNTIAQVSDFETGKEQYWYLFGQIELEKGSYNFQIYDKNSRISVVNSGDVVLRASNLSEPIVAPKLEFTKINPIKYRVKVKGANEPFLLVFLEAFHSGWKAYVQPATNSQQVTTDKFISEETAGTIQNDNLPKGQFYETYFKKVLPEGNHLPVNGYANSWWVDLSQVCKVESYKVESGEENYCVKNVDGSYDFSVIIEFEPQRFFDLGLLISGLTLISCLGYLGYDFVERRKKKKEEKFF